MKNNTTKVEQLNDYVFGFAPKSKYNISADVSTVPILMADAKLISDMMKHIASTNLLLQKLSKRPVELHLTHKETQKFFGISASTLRSWRQRGLLAYSQYERMIMFSFTDIEAFLKNHRHEAFQYSKNN